MSEELIQKSNQEVENTTSQTASADETNNDSMPSEGSTNSEPDYKALLEQEKAVRERAERKIVDLKREQKADKHSDLSSLDPDELVEKIWEKIDTKLSEKEMRAQQEEYDKTITHVSSNADEKALIQWHLEHTIRPTGNIETDVRRAKLHANEQKIIQANKELANSLRVRSTTQTAPNFGGSKLDLEEEPNLSEADKRILKAYGVDIKSLKK